MKSRTQRQRRLELDYRPEMPPPQFVPLGQLVVALSVLAVIALRPVFKSLASPMLYAIVAVAALTYLVVIYVRGRDAHAVSARAVTILLISIALVSDNPVAAYLLFGLALYRLAMQADWYQHHAAMWMRANLFLPAAVRRTWYSVWRPVPLWRRLLRGYRHLRGGDPDDLQALANPLSDPIRQMVRSQELPERIRYELGLSLLVPAYLMGFVILFLVPVSIFAGLAVVVFLTLLLAAYAFVNLNDYRRTAELNWRGLFHALSVARVTWWQYRGSYKPGVFKSPCGPHLVREWKSYVTHAFLAASIALLTAYFPFGPLLAGPTPWHEAAYDLQQEKPVFDEAAAYRSLPVETRLYAERLPPRERNAYVKASARLRHADRVHRIREAASGPLLSSPEMWVAISLRYPALFLVPLLLSATACVLFPYLFTFLALRALAGRTVVHHYLSLEDPDSLYQDPMHPWDAIVRRLRDSQNPNEREHLWVGVNAEDNTPVLVPRELLFQHAHVLGGTGTGKTSMAMTPLAAQLIGHDCSVVVLDLKGDDALFHTVRLQAENATLPDGTPSPLPFKWFRSESRHSTYAFNPFLQSHMKQFTPLERMHIFTKAFGLEYGEGYGKSHFSRQHRELLLALFKLRPEVESFRELAAELGTKDLIAKLQRETNRKDLDHAGDLFSMIRELAEIDAINITARSGLPAVLAEAIDMVDVVKHPSVIYFRLPAAISNASDREIGKFALHALLTAAQRYRTGRPVYLFIDEFQQIVSEDLEVIFEQARSFRIATILANHHQAQLAKAGPHVLKSVEETTAIAQVFSANDVEFRRTLQELSGESIYYFASYDRQGEASEFHEQIGPRHRSHVFMQMTARQNECWFRAKYNKGYLQTDGQPFIMYAGYHIPEKEFERRRAMPWPDAADHPQTLVMPLAGPPAAATPVVAAAKPASKIVPAPATPTTTVLDTLSFEGADDE